MGDRGRRRHRKLKEQPVLEGEVTDMDHEGRGVVKTDGKVVFVDECLPGETVRYQVRRRRRNYDEASLVEIVQPSDARVPPPCAHAAICGGCRLQHQSIESQRELKAHRLREDLERIGTVTPEQFLETITGPSTGYRRKARFAVKYVAGKGGVLIGFREKNAPYVAQIEQCEVVVPAFGHLIRPLRDLFSGISIPDRVPQLEIASGDDGNAMIVRHLEPLDSADAAALAEFGAKHGVKVLLQSAGPDSVVPLGSGDGTFLHYELEGLGRAGGNLRFRFQPTDFIQVNAVINRKLVAKAVELLNLTGRENVLDAFCGLGNFSLAVGLRAKSVLGVEGDVSLVEGARYNAMQNGVRNARFEVGDLFQPLIAERLAGGAHDRLLLDPPRSGALELVQALREPYPEQIVYVSCNSSTLARDAAVLVKDKGYRLVSAGLVDMFPHTAHAEAITSFVR